MEQKNQKEIWKKIWHNEKYEAEYYSGKIRNSKTGHILKTRKKKSRYWYAKLTLKNYKTREYLVHRLVAMAYHKPYNHKKQVNHNDKNRNNNKADNLSWVTVKQNIKHRDKQYLNY